MNKRGWKYRGANVQVSGTADILTIYRPDKARRWVVQRVLDKMGPWSLGEDPIETRRLPGEQFEMIVVQSDGIQPLWWALHRGHHAKKSGLSPFVSVDSPVTDLFTIELVQKPRQPRLVRAYPGDYIPPLPWMISAHSADGGKRACLEFWQHHAYVHHPKLTASSHGKPNRAPDWFLHS